MSTSRTEELELIEAALADHESREFYVLMTAFDLSPEHREILSRRLNEGLWRNASCPLSSLRRAVLSAMFPEIGRDSKTVGAALGLSAEKIGFARYKAETRDVVRGRDGVLRPGKGLYPQGDSEDGDASMISRVNGRFLKMINPKRLTKKEREYVVDPFPIVDWKAISKEVGLDDLEATYLFCYMTDTRGRSRMIADMAESMEDRKKIDAAIKRVKRKLNKINTILFN